MLDMKASIAAPVWQSNNSIKDEGHQMQGKQSRSHYPYFSNQTIGDSNIVTTTNNQDDMPVVTNIKTTTNNEGDDMPVGTPQVRDATTNNEGYDMPVGTPQVRDATGYWTELIYIDTGVPVSNHNSGYHSSPDTDGQSYGYVNGVQINNYGGNFEEINIGYGAGANTVNFAGYFDEATGSNAYNNVYFGPLNTTYGTAYYTNSS